MVSRTFIEFQLMYLILNELNNEDKNEMLISFLSDANPFMRKGENSVDVLLYNDFKQKYYSTLEHDNYSYNYICDFLKNLDYYGPTPYNYFIKITKEEYVDTCKEILNNDNDLLKQF